MKKERESVCLNFSEDHYWLLSERNIVIMVLIFEIDAGID